MGPDAPHLVPGRPDALRPTSLDEFVGQPSLVSRLRIVLEAAQQRNEVPDHMLFSGPPGLGKTTLAGIVAKHLGLPLVATSGPAIERPADLVGLLHDLRGPSVVFIDEIHRLEVHAEEVLYPAMEDGVLDIVVGDKVQARTVRLPLEPFVLVGATTQQGAISAPLATRFGFAERLWLYSEDDLTRVVQRSASLLELDLTDAGAREVARRSRSTPRVANTLLRRCRDWSQVNAVAKVDESDAAAALDAFGIDRLGLDEMARTLLHTVCTRFDGGPVGLKTLSAACGEAERTVEEVHEPFLMNLGMLARTPKGRVATSAGYSHLGIIPPATLPDAVDDTLGSGEAAPTPLPGLEA